MGVKLVITDLDETLVVKHQILTDRAKKCIEQLQARGILFGIASGRPLIQIEPYMQKFGVHTDVIIAYNGGEVHFMNENKSYSYYPMKAEWMKEVIDLMRPFDLVPNIVVGDTNYYTRLPWFQNWDMTKAKEHKYQFVPEEFFYRETPKLMLRLNEDSDMAEIERFVAAHPSENYKGFKTGPTLIEFTNKKVSKGFALKEICRIAGFDITDTIALGDTTNDNELLIEAGIGVCMANGSEDTKAIADVISDYPCDEDGWADYIEKHVLNENS